MTMKRSTTVRSICLIAGISLIAGTAQAVPFSLNVQNDVYGVAQGGVVNGIPTAQDDNDGLPDINDAANLLYNLAGLGMPFARNHHVDSLFRPNDSVWQELGNGTVALIGLTAGNRNTIGVYTDLGVGNARTNVLGPFSGFGFTGSGTIGSPFPAGTTGLALGQNFGWFLQSNQRFYSEPALNFDRGIDHLMSFDLSAMSGTNIYVDFGGGPTQLSLGANTFLLAWEDLPFNGNTAGDDDYDDMLYLVTSVPTNVPEPGTLALLALGAIGLVTSRRNQVRSRRSK
jgi:hypothetical protein